MVSSGTGGGVHPPTRGREGTRPPATPTAGDTIGLPSARLSGTARGACAIETRSKRKWPQPGRLRPCRNFTWSLEHHYAWLFYPHRIADRLGIGVRQLIAFLLPSAYLFRTVFP